MSRKRIAALTALAGAAGYVELARRDRAALSADPESQRLRRSLAPDVICLDPWGAQQLVVDAYGPQDAPAVVLVHGWTCTARFWTGQIQALRADHRVLAFDLRGHGRSSPPRDGDYSIEALADDLERVVSACIPADEPFVLGGHSLGAMTIVAWAARHPQSQERLAAAALVNTGIGELVGEARVAPLPSRLAALQAVAGPILLAAPGPIPKAGPLLRRAVRHVALGPGPGRDAPVRAGFGRTIAGLDLWESLEELHAPTVVVVGERDRLTPPSHGERMVAKLPVPVGLVQLAEAGHMGPIERADEVSDVIRGLTRGYVSGHDGALTEAL